MVYRNMPGEEFQLNSRLVDAGEEITFTLRGVASGDRFEVFPRYLESCDPTVARQSEEPLQWLEDLTPEVLTAQEEISYTAEAAGNYIARWTSERHGVLYRYFAVIDPTYVVYRPAIWDWPTPFPSSGGPEIHNGGLPLDWCIVTGNVIASQIPRLLEEQRRYGGGVVCGIDSDLSTLRQTLEDLRDSGLDVGRVANLWYGGGLSNDRVEAIRATGFDVVDGYVPRAKDYGLGAPYFPFYIGATDYRFPSQNGPTAAIAFVLDFVGSWHFHGPIGFHRPSAKGSWERARHYIDLAAQEAALTARNSGVHNVLTTLVNFESPVAWGDSAYQIVWDDERGLEFFENYMHLLAFEHPRRWPIVFARAVDYADYMRTHNTVMPRRIVNSITHDWDYDRYWTDEWHEKRVRPTGCLPLNQSLKSFRDERSMPQYNMPMSHEFINYCENGRTCRFEYACPKPVHYYDLAGSESWGAKTVETDVPDPEISVSIHSDRARYEVRFELSCDRRFPDYLMAIWDIPRECREWRIETNAKEFVWVENTDGNYRGIVRFDLDRSNEVTVALVR